MNEKWRDSCDQDETIGRGEARPNVQEDGTHSRRDFLIAREFRETVCSKLAKGFSSLERWADAEVGKKEGEKQKVCNEAAQIAARTDNDEATNSQDVLKKKIENLKAIEELSPESRTIALAEYYSNDPDILEQLNRVADLVNKVETVRGGRFEPQPEGARKLIE